MAETVRYTGDGNELFWRERVENLHAGAQVIVPDTHTLFIIRDGSVSAPLPSGRHDVFPVGSRLKADEGRAVEFAFVSHIARMSFLWGTPSPVRTVDPETRVPVALGLNGEIELGVRNPRLFFDEFVGANIKCDAEAIKARVVSRLMTVVEPALSDVVSRNKVSFAEFDGVRHLLAAELGKRADALLIGELGLEVGVFTVAGAIVPEADVAAINAKREELGIGKKQCPFCDAFIDAKAKFCKVCGAITD